MSSAQRLPNGNTLIDEGADGRLFAVTSAKEIVWECPRTLHLAPCTPRPASTPPP